MNTCVSAELVMNHPRIPEPIFLGPRHAYGMRDLNLDKFAMAGRFQRAKVFHLGIVFSARIPRSVTTRAVPDGDSQNSFGVSERSSEECESLFGASKSSCEDRREFSGARKRSFEESEKYSGARKNRSSEGGAAAGNAVEARLLHRLGKTLTGRQLLRPGQRVLVAVSGGQDSVCLLHLLVKLQSKWGWKLGIVHCDHQWSSSARQQARHVAQLASSLGLDYYQALTTKPVLGEGVARTWRYGILQRIAVSHGYEAIVTAHTASDRIETLLFNMCRGSGVRGLQSLTWKRLLSPSLSLSRQSAFQEHDPIQSVEDPRTGTIPVSKARVALIRPLLDVTRTELRQLRQQLELPLWPDPSNHSFDIGRNRIRHELLPYLRKHFNAGVDKSLARWAEILHGEQEFLSSLCESIRVNAESDHTGPGAEVGRKLDVLVLRSLPLALQRRVLKQFSDGFTGKSLGFDTVERVRQACLEVSVAKKGLQVSVPGGYYLRVSGNDLIIAKDQAKEKRK